MMGGVNTDTWGRLFLGSASPMHSTRMCTPQPCLLQTGIGAAMGGVEARGRLCSGGEQSYCRANRGG